MQTGFLSYIIDYCTETIGACSSRPYFFGLHMLRNLDDHLFLELFVHLTKFGVQVSWLIAKQTLDIIFAEYLRALVKTMPGLITVLVNLLCFRKVGILLGSCYNCLTSAFSSFDDYNKL